MFSPDAALPQLPLRDAEPGSSSGQRQQQRQRLFGSDASSNGSSNGNGSNGAGGAGPGAAALSSYDDDAAQLADRAASGALASSSSAWSSGPQDSQDSDEPAGAEANPAAAAAAAGQDASSFHSSRHAAMRERYKQGWKQRQRQSQQPQPQQQQQQQQQPQQPYHQRASALRTVQWYRDQANRRLTNKISRVQDLAGLRQVMRQYEGAMNHIHINALFGRLAKLVHQRQLRPKDMLALPALLPQVLGLVAAGLPDFDERSISNVLHGMAVLELDQERELLNSLLAAAESVQLSTFTPQGLANTAWALAALHTHPGPRLTQKLLSASVAVMDRFKAVELAQLGWAVASLQVRVPEPWVVAWRAAVQRELPQLTPQGMSMVMWGVARMADSQLPPLPPAPALQLQQAPAGAGASSSGSLQAGAADGELLGWLQQVQADMGGRLFQHSPHSLGVCLWAMARLGYRPPRTWLWQALEAVKHKLQREGRAVDLAVLLYSLAGLGFRPRRAWLEAHGAALRVKLSQVSVREVSNLLWAYGKLGRLPEANPVMPALLNVIFYNMQEANARDLANSLWALATLGVTPPKPWMGIFGAQAEALVHDFSPQEISNLLWAYAKLGYKPPHMLLVALWEGVGAAASPAASLGSPSSPSSASSSSMAALGMGTGLGGASGGSRLSAFKPQELSMLVWALATLRVAPGKEWWEQFLQASYHKMQQQLPQGLAGIIWSLSELQLQPPPAWLYTWAAATRAALPAMTPIDLGQVAAALQSSTLAPLQLPKLEALLLDVLDRLAAVEVQSGAYSKAAMQLLMRMPSPAAGAGGTGRGAAAAGGSRARRPQQQQPQQQQLGEKNSSSGSSSVDSSSSSSSDEVAGVRAALEGMMQPEAGVDDAAAAAAAGPGAAQQLRHRMLQLQQSLIEAVGDTAEGEVADGGVAAPMDAAGAAAQ